MRHYYGYDVNGTLRTVEVYGPAGWPAEQCLEDPDCIDPSVTSLRESRAKTAPEVIAWVLFDCQCDASQGALVNDCVCFNTKMAESYVDTVSKTLVNKPLRTVYVDDVEINSGDIVTRDPGTQISFKITSQGMPDGNKARCSQKGLVDLTLEDEWEMIFAGGRTALKTLTTPAQGTRGGVGISGDLLRPFIFFLRGFATE
jgi:hypothetical protein